MSRRSMQLSKPWTSEVSYAEHRTLSIQGANVSLQTVSDDEITLVQTFSGVKLRKVKSEVYKADGDLSVALQPVPPTVSPSMRSVG